MFYYYILKKRKSKQQHSGRLVNIYLEAVGVNRVETGRLETTPAPQGMMGDEDAGDQVP